MDISTDVLVIGSGAAGLAAALAASTAGARVHVVEKANVVGGTSAMSGGVLWVPGHSYPADGVPADSVASALDYLRKATRGQVADEPLESYLREAPAMLKFIEDNTTLRLAA